MASIWDFVKGTTDYLVSAEEQRMQAEQELKRATALEKMRRETSDYEFNRSQTADLNKVDKNLSGYNPDTGKFDVYNSEGKLLRSQDANPSMKAAYESDKADKDLDREAKRASIDNIAVDNALQRESLNLTRRGQDISASNSRRSNSIDSAGGKKILTAEFGQLEKVLAETENPSLIANMRSEFYNGVNMNGWSEKQQRNFINTAMKQAIPFVNKNQKKLQSAALLLKPTE